MTSHGLSDNRSGSSWRARWPWLAYAAIVVLAALLRLGGLSQAPHTLWVDEAWFGAMGQDVLRGQASLPLQPPGLGVGDSAAQIYASAAVQALGAPAAYSSRLASALFGLLAVALLYPALLGLLADVLAPPLRQAAALVATAILATLFTALLYSRTGQQMSGAALATLLAAVCLYQTFRRGRWRWALAAGVVIGLAQTTYEAALALPALLLAYTAVRLIWPGALARRRVLALGALAVAAGLLAFAPMLVFYWFHPGIFLAHVEQTQTVQPAGGLLASLSRAGQGLARVWLGLSLWGDALPGRNLAGRPLLDPLTSILFWLGLAWAAAHARQRPALQLLLLWLVVLSLPSALSDDAPAFSRMLPMVPVIVALAGLGAAVLWRWAAGASRGRAWAAGGLLGLGLLLAGTGGVRAYFVDWPVQPGLFDALGAGPRLAADQALADSAAADVFLTPRTAPFVLYPFQLLLAGTPVKLFDAAPECLPYANSRARSTDYGVVQVLDKSHVLARLQAAYPAGRVAQTVPHPDGYSYAVFFEVPPGTPAPAPPHAVDVQFEGGLRLVGYALNPTARPGEQVTLTLYWEADQPLPANLTAFAHLGKGRLSQPLIAQTDGPICPGWAPDRWQAGYRYIETRTLAVAADAPADQYDLRVGVYEPGAQVRQAIVQADVPVEDNRAVLGPFTVR